MCGLVGVFNFDGAPVTAPLISSMMAAQAHRGPDDSGMRLFSLRGNARSEEPERGAEASETFEGGVGFNRLSILDVSQAGHQPMLDESGQVFIAFNGEIYNAFEHRALLESEGIRFRSRTDTEVILALYNRYGFEEMLARLNGMFAFCLVDLKRREIRIVRDRFGIKPLYWWRGANSISFASEVKSLLPLAPGGMSPAIANIPEFLHFGYAAGSRTLFDGIHHLEPGCWLHIDHDGVSQHRYWALPQRTSSFRGSFEDAVDALDDRLRGAVRAQLLSDVTLGCQLSGGIDSSIVSLFATQESGGRLDGISVTLDDEALTEEKWAREAAARAEIEMHAVNLSANSFAQAFEDATWHMDQPINHPSAIGIFRLAETANEHVTVLLSGEGADEMFGGYHRFAFVPLADRLGTIATLLTNMPVIGGRFRERLTLDGDRRDPAGRMIRATASRDPALAGKLIPSATWSQVSDIRRDLAPAGAKATVGGMLDYEIRTYLPDLLIRQDKMTMAHSIENRVPFLDHQLTDFVFTLPTDYLVRLGVGMGARTSRYLKRPLKSLSARYFGDEFAYRGKMGFGLPVKDILDHSSFHARIEDQYLPGIKSRGWLDNGTVRKLWRERKAMNGAATELLWRCISLEAWAQTFMDRSSRTAAAS